MCHWHTCETTAAGNSGLYRPWLSPGDIPDRSPREAAPPRECVRLAMDVLLLLRRELAPTTTYQLPLVVLVVTQRAGLAALLSSSISPDVTGYYMEII